MNKTFKEISKKEDGNFTMFVLFIIFGLMIFIGFFFNTVMSQMSVGFAKKAIEEATRTRALAVDIPLKENKGIVEVMNYPYSGSYVTTYPSRPFNGFGGVSIPSTSDTKYRDAVDYAEIVARDQMVETILNSVGNGNNDSPMIKITRENICFDVEPLLASSSVVEFKCPLKGPDGKVYTITAQIPVRGFDDASGINKFNDATLDGNDREVTVSNVVFGAAMIAPHPFITNKLFNLGYVDGRTNTIVYSVAYPQIDECYGGFC